MGFVVRWLLVPALLLPLLPPWFLLLALFLIASLLSGIVGLCIDLVVVLAEHLRRQRKHIEGAASCLQCLMRWVCKTYTLWLLRARSRAEDAVFSIGSALAPFGVRLMERSPLLARFVSPVLYVLERISQACDNAYAFAHDEIVPVGLDIAERLPLVEELLLRHGVLQSPDGTDEDVVAGNGSAGWGGRRPKPYF